MTAISEMHEAPYVRSLKKRWVLLGELELLSPMSIGGDETGLSDKGVLRDALTGEFIITGESLAGALRSYLLDYEQGYHSPEMPNDFKAAQKLFGFNKVDEHGDTGLQSPLIIFDARARASASEMRDGIRRNAETDVVEDGAKFDFEVVPRGTTFIVRFDLLIADTANSSDPEIRALADENAQLAALALVLSGLESGEVRLGAFKHKGLGQCLVKKWQVTSFDLSTASGWQAWLDSPYELQLGEEGSTHSIAEVFKDSVHSCRLLDQRKRALFTLELRQVDGMLLAGGLGIADANSLLSNGKPVLSGRTLNGALRARARKILNTLEYDSAMSGQMVENLFGSQPSPSNASLKAGRLQVGEGILENTTTLFNTRVAIDPFTGGTVDGALFNETPVFGGKVTVTLELKTPSHAEIGLLLLVLRDLIMEDITIGSTGSIGRGRFTGTVGLKHENNHLLMAKTGTLPEHIKELEHYVTKFHKHFQGVLQ